jgi:prenyltransferase beta subunit
MSLLSLTPRLPFDRLVKLCQTGANLLDSGARDEIASFLATQRQESGAFHGPGKGDDLYYTFFGLALHRALDVATPPVEAWLESFGDGEGLSLADLCSLAIARSCLCATPAPKAWRRRIVSEQLERFRQPDGGFSDAAGVDYGTPYGGYLATLAAHSLDMRLPRFGKVVAAAQRCQAGDGGYAEHLEANRGTVPSTLAALALRTLRWKRPARRELEWFEECRRGDGFAAAPDVPVADLLCTATLLAANRGQRLGIPVPKRTIAEFVESCWAPDGGFGAAPGTKADTEYTFYALLALGSLA